jgi:hypothetical protein
MEYSQTGEFLTEEVNMMHFHSSNFGQKTSLYAIAQAFVNFLKKLDIAHEKNTVIQLCREFVNNETEKTLWD